MGVKAAQEQPKLHEHQIADPSAQIEVVNRLTIQRLMVGSTAVAEVLEVKG
jgi:hypothetical protein